MPRNSAAYLCDIIATCNSIDEVLSRRDPALAMRITHSRLIVGFRNRLIHEYPQIDAETVYAIAQHDTSILRDECAVLLKEVDESVL